MTGYTKEKADKLIEKHERRAEELERRAREESQYETFRRGGSSNTSREARQERDKAENLRALKRHHGD